MKYTLDMNVLENLKCLEILPYNKKQVKIITWYRDNPERQPKYNLIYDRMVDSRYQKLIGILQTYDKLQATTQEVFAIFRFKDADNDQYCFKTEKALPRIYREGYAMI